MSSGIAAFAAVNVVMLALGCGLLPLLRLARTRRDLVVQLPLAYAVGLAATGVLAAELAVFGVAVGPVLLSLATVVALAAGLPGLPAGERSSPRRPRAKDIPALALLGVTSVYVLAGVRLAAVAPLGPGALGSWDTRARALYSFGRPSAPVFTDLSYGPLQQPLLLPALEAVGFRFAGTFDGTLLNLQLLALRRGARRRSLDAPAPLDEPDSAGGFAPRDRHRPGTLQPSARRLGRHPARHLPRTRRREPRGVAPKRSRRPVARRRRSSSAPLP